MSTVDAIELEAKVNQMFERMHEKLNRISALLDRLGHLKQRRAERTAASTSLRSESGKRPMRSRVSAGLRFSK